MASRRLDWTVQQLGPSGRLLRLGATVTWIGPEGILVSVEVKNAFAAVYQRDAERVLVFLARRTLDGALAADLTAETFAIAYSSWSRLERRSEEEVRAWLSRVARRQLSRYRRRARVEERPYEEVARMLGYPNRPRGHGSRAGSAR